MSSVSSSGLFIWSGVSALVCAVMFAYKSVAILATGEHLIIGSSWRWFSSVCQSCCWFMRLETDSTGRLSWSPRSAGLQPSGVVSQPWHTSSEEMTGYSVQRLW